MLYIQGSIQLLLCLIQLSIAGITDTHFLLNAKLRNGAGLG